MKGRKEAKAVNRVSKSIQLPRSGQEQNTEVVVFDIKCASDKSMYCLGITRILIIL